MLLLNLRILRKNVFIKNVINIKLVLIDSIFFFCSFIDYIMYLLDTNNICKSSIVLQMVIIK